MDYRMLSAHAKCTVTQLYNRRYLPSFMFRPIYHINYTVYRILIISFFNDLLYGDILFYIHSQYRIQNRIRGQRILVPLIWPQFGRGSLNNDIIWNYFIIFVDKFAQL